MSQASSSGSAWSRLGGQLMDRRPWVAVALAAVVTLALRAPFVGAPVYPDEGGYLLVAHYWHRGGPYLYGDLFVDRPPLLLAIFKVADSLGGLVALRIIGAVFVVGLVVVAGWAGWLIGGSRGSRWAAFLAAALASSPLLAAPEVDGELLAAPLVLLSCTLMLAATRQRSGRSRATAYAVLAGVSAMAAILVKQNFVDAGVFAVVLLAASVLSRRQSWTAALRLMGSFVAGGAIPATVAAVWAAGWGSGVGDLWFAVYGFRWRALGVLSGQNLIPADRLHALDMSAWESGTVSLAVIFVFSQYRELGRLDPLVVAVTTMLASEVFGVALGGNYWLHYLIQLVPSLVLASACLASSGATTLVVARIGLGVVMLSAVGNALNGAIPLPHPVGETAAFETWIHTAARPSDSLVVTYGHANLFKASGLHPVYDHLWSLPMRVLDPGLVHLSATLAGPQPPTWVLEWDRFEYLGDAPAVRLRATLATHYHQVADICGHPIFLLDGVNRPLPADIGSCS